jgi:hypothetical protein
MDTRIEYAIAERGEVQVLMGEDRERALRLAASWNRKNPGTATVMERTVTKTDWVPVNTGIVPPHITERIEE